MSLEPSDSFIPQHIIDTLAKFSGPVAIPLESDFWLVELNAINASLSRLDSFEIEALLLRTSQDLCMFCVFCGDEDGMKNNATSKNLNQLLRITVLTLQGMPSNLLPVPVELLYFLFLTRFFIKYFIENLDCDHLIRELNISFDFAPKSEFMLSPSPETVPTSFQNQTSEPTENINQNPDIAKLVAANPSKHKRTPSNTSVSTVISINDSNIVDVTVKETPINTRISSGAGFPDETIPQRLVRSILDACIDIELNSSTYNLHLELVSTIMVLTSTQLYGNLAQNYKNLFLGSILSYSRFLDFTQALIMNFIDRLPETHLRYVFYVCAASIFSQIYGLSTSATLIDKITSSVSKLFLLPYTVYQYFFPPGPSDFPLSDRSILLLLILCYQPCRKVIETNLDSKINNSLELDISNNNYLITISNISDDLNSRSSHAKSIISSVESVPYSCIYDALATCVCEEWSMLLFYTMLHRNVHFREYVFAKSDLDLLLLPMLESCYVQVDLSCNRVYMVLIVLLILSQDESFAENAHSRLIIPSVPWFKERILRNVSLGSLIMIILFRIMQKNLSKLRDPFIHTNCLATLSNMAPHVINLHSFAADRMVTLVKFLMQKFQKLSVEINDSKHTEDELDELTQEYSTFTEFIRVLLETIYLCIQPFSRGRSVDKHNSFLVYSLLTKKEEVLIKHESFVNVVSVLKQSCDYFEGCISRARLPELTVEAVLQVLVTACRNWSGVPAESGLVINDLKFSYEEQIHPEEFFLPYIWTIVFDVSKIKWYQTSRISIFSVSQHEKYNQSRYQEEIQITLDENRIPSNLNLQSLGDVDDLDESLEF